jgi:hypothetical protein
MIASSARRAAARRVGTAPASACHAMSLMARTLPREKPARRSLAGRAAETSAGEGKRPFSNRATNRVRIVSAARPLSC